MLFAWDWSCCHRRLLILHIASGLLYGAAGFCVFLMLLNRVLILLPGSRAKVPVILAVVAGMVGPCVLAGVLWPRLPWLLAPLVLLGLVLAGEARRAYIRRSCAGTGPVDTTPHTVHLANPITTTDLVVHRYEVPHPKWRGAPLRIVHLTDLHVHPSLPLDYYKEVFSVAEQARPDMAVCTGDFISRREALPRLREILRPVARQATYAVLGNHDYWTDAEAVRRVVLESGLRLVSDESLALSFGDNPILLTGYDHPWGKRRKSLPPREGGPLHVVLSHTPDNIYRLSKSSADIVFSGHYHAGQIRVPKLGPIVVPSVYGRRFDHGHFVVNGTHLFVASGIGSAEPPFRIYCQPDIFVVDIVPAKVG